MRRNAFGEAYLESEQEIVDFMINQSIEPDLIYTPFVDYDGAKHSCEVCDAVTGDTMFFVEMDDEAELREALEGANIEMQF